MEYFDSPSHLNPVGQAEDWGEIVTCGDFVGRYRLLEPIGRGGMGVVYSAEDPELDRTVALKFLRASNAGSAEANERFIREARSASALNHPNIVTVYDLIRTESGLAMAMELIHGTLLREFCDGSCSNEQLSMWTLQIAEALGAAHARGIVHRDIKPENVMVRTDGRVKVLDFGLARQLTHPGLSRTGDLPTGTIRYLSPEQLTGGLATCASDIFSLGIVLYQLATGVHPFEREFAIATGHAIVTATAVNPCRRNHTISSGFGSLILQMLSKDPIQRPSASAIVTALSGQTESISRMSPVAKTSRLRRARSLAVPMLLLLAILFAAAVLLFRISTPIGPVASFEKSTRPPTR